MSSAHQRGGAREVDLRDRIRQCALELFAECGYAATSMRDIAEASACTKPALYYHFDSKQGLFVEVLRTLLDRLDDLVGEHLSRPLPVRDRMVRAGAAYLEFVRANRSALRLLMRAELHPERAQPPFDFDSYRLHHVDQITAIIQHGIEQGEVREDVDLATAIDALVGGLEMRVMLFVGHGEPIPDDYPERIVELMFRGLSP